jgi:citrate lyase subunit beta/citryl-CoA lyase
MTADSAFAWRSLLFVPATNPRFTESALRQQADALQIDLEDSIAPDQKIQARALVPELADRYAAAGFDVVVRVNRPWRLLVRDIEACVRQSVKALTIPKVPDASFLLGVAEVLAECEIEAGLPVGHTRLIAMIEDAVGLENMAAIAAAHPRVCAMIVGAEDLATSMRMAVDTDSLYVPNVMAVAACRRAGIAPLGFVGSVADFADRDIFSAAVQRAARLGFEGAFCIHPAQVDLANAAFTPPQASVDRARALLAEFERQCAAGRAACTFEGRMVDAPVAAQARQIVARFEEIAAMRARRN